MKLPVVSGSDTEATSFFDTPTRHIDASRSPLIRNWPKERFEH